MNMLDVKELYYDLDKDEGGYPLESIHYYILPSIISLFKIKKEDMLVFSKFGQPIELIYPE
jgi:hypothetical protein